MIHRGGVHQQHVAHPRARHRRDAGDDRHQQLHVVIAGGQVLGGELQDVVEQRLDLPLRCRDDRARLEAALTTLHRLAQGAQTARVADSVEHAGGVHLQVLGQIPEYGREHPGGAGGWHLQALVECRHPQVAELRLDHQVPHDRDQLLLWQVLDAGLYPVQPLLQRQLQVVAPELAHYLGIATADQRSHRRLPDRRVRVLHRPQHGGGKHRVLDPPHHRHDVQRQIRVSALGEAAVHGLDQQILGLFLMAVEELLGHQPGVPGARPFQVGDDLL